MTAAALACACLLTTPYVLDYDLVMLAVVIAYFTNYGLAMASANTRSTCWRSSG
jgi:alpha-1,2-mannosyltransferase